MSVTVIGVRFNIVARSFTSSRKSTRPSAVKKKITLLLSNVYSTSISFIGKLCCAIFSRQISTVKDEDYIFPIILRRFFMSVTVIGVRFKEAGKIYYFDPGELTITTNDHVIVETARGIEYGNVVVGLKEVDESGENIVFVFNSTTSNTNLGEALLSSWDMAV